MKATCAHCGAMFEASRRDQRFCSRRCNSAAHRNSSERTCAEPDCGRPVRARDLCGSHYNRRYTARTYYDITCAHCGSPHRTRRPDGKYCSHECYVATHSAPLREPIQPKSAGPRFYVWEVEQALPQPKQCAVCRRAYAFAWPSKFCSQACETEFYRFRTESNWISNEERLRIYARDGWRCGICGKPVRKDWDIEGWLGPTLDHIVPRAEGGSDDAANLRLAHSICNSRRGARGGGEQLALIG